MRYLILLLALALVGCGLGTRVLTDIRVTVMIEDCDARGLTGRLPESDSQSQCIAEALTAHCLARFESGYMLGEDHWIDCVAENGGEYCEVYYYEDRPTFDLCANSIVDTVSVNDPYRPLLSDAIDEVHNRCDKAHESGELPTWVARASCINEGLDGAYQQYRFSRVLGGQLRWTARKRLQIAERLDAGVISKAEADRELEKFVEMCWDKPAPPECRIR